jgi:hypothetical protein
VPTVRILLGALPTSLLGAVAELVRSHQDLEVVGAVPQPSDLLLAAGLLRADVVLVGMVGEGLPGIASHLLDQYPHLKVAAVAPDAQQVLVYTSRPHLIRLPVPPAPVLSPVDVLADAIRTATGAFDD